MFERKWHVGISVLISLLTISFIAAVLITPPVFSQENATENAIFSVSPGAFTASQVPPTGEPYIIPQVLVVWNRDNIERVVYITSKIPSENDVTPGYVPIPNENWVIPLFENNYSSSFTIPENSYAVIQLSFDIPRWENLTGRKWEVWIPVERQALPEEPVVYGLTVKIKIETTKELPPVGKGIDYLVLLAAGLLIAMVVISVGIWYKMRPRRGRARVLV